MPPILTVYKALPPAAPATPGAPPAAEPLTMVGQLDEEGGHLTFTYSEAAIELGPVVARLSVRLDVRRKPHPDHVTRPFFENLLPEGEGRRLLTQATRTVDVAGLLGAIGGECAGAVSLWPMGETPPPPTYRPLTTREVEAQAAPADPSEPPPVAPSPEERARWAAQLETDFQRAGTYAAVRKVSRQAMSGAQDKLVLWRRPLNDPAPDAASAAGPDVAPFPDYRLPLDGAPSLVLCKWARPRFPGLLANELAAMRLMQAAGVPTAACRVSRLHVGVFETVRFDRWVDATGTVGRLHQEDGCQLVGASSDAKYGSGAGAPTYQRLVTALRQSSVNARRDIPRLFTWAVANLAVGNRDAHAKNIALLYTPDGPVLAPAYDVVCTLPYGLDESFPLPFGGVRHLAACTPHVLRKASREFGLDMKVTRTLVADACTAIRDALDAALHAAAEAAGEHPVLGVMRDAILTSTAAVEMGLLREAQGVGLPDASSSDAPTADPAAPDTVGGAVTSGAVRMDDAH